MLEDIDESVRDFSDAGAGAEIADDIYAGGEWVIFQSISIQALCNRARLYHRREWEIIRRRLVEIVGGYCDIERGACVGPRGSLSFPLQVVLLLRGDCLGRNFRNF